MIITNLLLPPHFTKIITICHALHVRSSGKIITKSSARQRGGPHPAYGACPHVGHRGTGSWYLFEGFIVLVVLVLVYQLYLGATRTFQRKSSSDQWSSTQTSKKNMYFIVFLSKGFELAEQRRLHTAPHCCHKPSKPGAMDWHLDQDGDGDWDRDRDPIWDGDRDKDRHRHRDCYDY